MKQEKVYALFEAVADNAYIAAKENFRTNDSRERSGQFIEWAKEFEYLHKHMMSHQGFPFLIFRLKQMLPETPMLEYTSHLNNSIIPVL
jgi:hypothetical protein